MLESAFCLDDPLTLTLSREGRGNEAPIARTIGGEDYCRRRAKPLSPRGRGVGVRGLAANPVSG